MNRSTWVTKVLLALVVVLTVITTASADSIVYSQPAQYPGPFGGAWTSDFGFDPAVAGNRGFWTFDSFQLPTTQRIDGVQFQGLYWDFQNNGNNPVAPETASWEFSFWDSQFGFFPGNQLSVQTVPAAQVQAEFQGYAFFGGLPNVPLPVYNFTVDLPESFTAQGNQTYWMSILSQSPSFNPVWIWMPGNGPDNTSIQYTLANGRVITGGAYVGNDRAFTLTQVVPEPTGLGVLLILGGSALVGRRLRRRPTPAVAV